MREAYYPGLFFLKQQEAFSSLIIVLFGYVNQRQLSLDVDVPCQPGQR